MTTPWHCNGLQHAQSVKTSLLNKKYVRNPSTPFLRLELRASPQAAQGLADQRKNINGLLNEDFPRTTDFSFLFS